MQAEDDIISQTPKVFPLPPGKRNRSFDEDNEKNTQHDDAHVSASSGSDQSFNNLSTHSTWNHRFKETGFFGQASEVQWLSNVHRQMQQTGTEPYATTYELFGSDRDAKRARSDDIRGGMGYAKSQRRQGSWEHITYTSFFLDSSALPTDEFFNPYEIPDPETAEQLFDCYINAVHHSFPLVSQIIRCIRVEYTDPVLKQVGLCKFRGPISQIHQFRQT
jgi:hypothetical protein